MKTLRESLLDDDLVGKTDKSIKDEVKAFLKENYIGSIRISRKPNADGKYEVSSFVDIGVKNRNITSLTNGMFIWATVDGYFECIYCIKLESLEGAPKEVGEYFDCSGCKSLESLEGAPKEVGDNFCCSRCNSLKSLEGAPKEVRKDFDCYGCKSLTSLEGAPKEVGRGFYCHNCKVKFTKDDVKKVSNVKGEIKC